VRRAPSGSSSRPIAESSASLALKSSSHSTSASQRWISVPRVVARAGGASRSAARRGPACALADALRAISAREAPEAARSSRAGSGAAGSGSSARSFHQVSVPSGWRHNSGPDAPGANAARSRFAKLSAVLFVLPAGSTIMSTRWRARVSAT
jgi:hypothetical protein